MGGHNVLVYAATHNSTIRAMVAIDSPATYPAFAKHDVVGNLQVLNGTETLVLVGAQDLLTPAEHSKVLVREIPGAELVVLDPGGHLIMLERPDDTNAHLIDLIDRAARGVGRRRHRHLSAWRCSHSRQRISGEASRQPGDARAPGRRAQSRALRRRRRSHALRLWIYGVRAPAV